MAKIPKEVTLKIITNLENITTQISVISSRINRVQHIFKELQASLAELENDINNCDVVLKLVQTEKEEENAQQYKSLV